MNDQEYLNSTGGLFPEDETPVKRENPYLKKNKKPAEKPPKPPKEKKQKPERSAADPQADAPETEGAPRRRTLSQFYFEHVKLITAVVTIALIMTLIGATGVVAFFEELAERQEQAGKKPLTITYVEGLTKKSGPITWADLEDFARYNTSDAKNSVTWFFRVQDTPYEIWISGVSTDKAPTYVKLFDMTTGAEMDVKGGDLDKFIEENPITQED